MVRAFAHGAMGRRIDPSWGDPLSYFSFQPVLHDWCNKGCCMCYPVCGMMDIKEPLLLIGKSSPFGCSGFPLSQSEWSFTICPTPYNCKENVLSASLNKIHSFNSNNAGSRDRYFNLRAWVMISPSSIWRWVLMTSKG